MAAAGAEAVLAPIGGRQLVVDHRIAPATFEEARERLGVRGLVELTATIGYYAMIAAPLNAFEVEG